MLHFVLLVATFFVPSQSWLVDNMIDYFFNSFDGDKFSNVGVGQTVECGKDKDGAPRDCIILCDKTNSCANSTFKVRSANIQIICQMPGSCANVYIDAQYTQSLNMSFMASNAFLNGFYIGTGNDRVITECSFGEACKSSTFYYQDREVYHNCSSWNGDWSSHGACRHSKIVTLRGKVTLDFSNSQAFYPGSYFGYQNEEVTTYCRSDSSCESATFHYDALTPVKHYCMDKNACASTIIHALTRTDVDCAGKKSHASTYSCYSTQMISATNNYSVTVHGYDYAPDIGNRMALYLTSTYNMNDLVICEDDCKPDGIVYYAANDYNYEHNCSRENANCLDEVAAFLRNNPFTVYDNYYWDIKGRIDEVWTSGALLTIQTQFPDKLWNENTWRTTPKYGTKTLTAPKGLADNDFFVLCIDCKNTEFYLRDAANAVIYTTKSKQSHSSWIKSSYIETSSGEFTFIGPGNDGSNITINATASDQVNIYNIGMWSEVYLGDVLDVNINCTYPRACIGVDVYTDINPMEEAPLSEHSEFHVECASITWGASACEYYGGYPQTLQYGFYLDFSYLNKKCRISKDGPDITDCPFLNYGSVRSNAHSSDVDSVPGYVVGLIIAGGVVVLLVVAALIFCMIGKRKKMQQTELYVNLNDSTL